MGYWHNGIYLQALKIYYTLFPNSLNQAVFNGGMSPLHYALNPSNEKPLKKFFDFLLDLIKEECAKDPTFKNPLNKVYYKLHSWAEKAWEKQASKNSLAVTPLASYCSSPYCKKSGIAYLVFSGAIPNATAIYNLATNINIDAAKRIQLVFNLIRYEKIYVRGEDVKADTKQREADTDKKLYQNTQKLIVEEKNSIKILRPRNSEIAEKCETAQQILEILHERLFPEEIQN